MTCRDSYKQERETFLLWRGCGKPKKGPVYTIYRKARTNFKYTQHFCKSQEAVILSDKMAAEMSAKDYDSFGTL